MANLGFIGLGVMGGQMVDRLLEKGHTRDRLQPHAIESAVADREGMKLGRSPRAVAAAPM